MNHHRLYDYRISKETFLEQNGVLVSNEVNWMQVPNDFVVIIWLKNEDNTIAIIVMNNRDLGRCQSPSDKRERKTYLVPIKKLIPHVQRDCVEDLQARLAASNT